MAETMTLAELKAQNAATTEEEESKVTIDLPETESEEVEEEQQAEPEAEAESEGDEKPEESEEVEDWMRESSDDDDEKPGFKPNREAAAVRKKLRAKLHEKDDELEQLRQENERLKQSYQAPEAEKLPPRPKLEDFDYDEAKHEAALDDWYDKKAEAKAKQVMSSSQTEAQQREQAERNKKALEESVNRHYERAAKLVSEGKISEEKYTNADRVVRESFERIAPKQGDVIVDSLIKTLDSLGEGSEKVMYQLGVNPAKMQEVTNAFASDPSGLSAVALLGKMQASITSPVKRKSSAPPPSHELSQAGSGKGAADKLHQQYKKAGDNLQKRIDIKREAKRSGVDTSKW